MSSALFLSRPIIRQYPNKFQRGCTETAREICQQIEDLVRDFKEKWYVFVTEDEFYNTIHVETQYDEKSNTSIAVAFRIATHLKYPTIINNIKVDRYVVVMYAFDPHNEMLQLGQFTLSVEDMISAVHKYFSTYSEGKVKCSKESKESKDSKEAKDRYIEDDDYSSQSSSASPSYSASPVIAPRSRRVSIDEPMDIIFT